MADAASPASQAPAEAGGILTVDLDALAANWRSLARRAAGAECAAVVKADAYGTGAARAVPALWNAVCRTFFTAQLAEGIALRKAVPHAAIYVLNGLLPGTEALYLAHDLRPVLGALPEVEAWRAHAAGRSVPPAALHVDTGMNRLGLEVADALALGAAGAGFPLALVMSHLACAEEVGHALTARQAQRFAAVRAAFPGVPGSLANSSGIFLDAALRHDVVRPGYALYGGSPLVGALNPMRGVVGLEARIVQVGVAEDGEAVGYGGDWTARGRRRLAVIAVGYGDGYPRALGSGDDRPGGDVLVRGVRCPIAGRLSMDLTTIDVTAVAGDLAHGDLARGDLARGDTVTLIGGELTIDRVAAAAGTIGYQVLTSLGRRHYRRYVGG